MRRLIEGQRVNAKIEEMIRNDQSGENPTSGMARQSDFDKLQEFDEQVKSRRRN